LGVDKAAANLWERGVLL